MDLIWPYVFKLLLLRLLSNFKILTSKDLNFKVQSSATRKYAIKY